MKKSMNKNKNKMSSDIGYPKIIPVLVVLLTMHCNVRFTFEQIKKEGRRKEEWSQQVAVHVYQCLFICAV